MEMQSITAASTAQSRGAASGSGSLAGSNELGKDEFLQLLVIQMENQDPLNPMDNTQMIAQLAQFSALEQMQNLNASFAKIQHQGNLSQAMALNGKNVHLEFQDGSIVEGLVEKVMIQNGELYLQIGGVLYPASSITSVAFLEDEESGGSGGGSGSGGGDAPDSGGDSGGGSAEPASPVSPDQPDVGVFGRIASLISG
jgi:flagellar basal-body rod modification protein FlgD